MAEKTWTWVEVAEHLRRGGWETTLAPLAGFPSFLWRSPDGISGSDFRSFDWNAPPDAVMQMACESGLIDFVALAPLTP